MRERTVVIVSPYFPPSTLAGVHRARHLAKHLPAAGWHPIVLCVHEKFHEQKLDPGLAALVPAQSEIIKVPAWPAALCRRFGFGDIGLRAWTALRRTLHGLLQSRTVDAVLVTGSPFYPMLLAATIRRHFSVPVVLDFQDPWVSHWGEQQPRLSKAGISHRLALWLEPRALRSASFITSVSETQNQQMATRYPWLEKSRMAAIPIGGDADDFARVRPCMDATAKQILAPGLINISYVGTVWPPAYATVRLLLRALARLRADDPAHASRIRLNFVGTTANPNDATSYQVMPLAQSEGVADAVREIPQRIPYLEALSITARSDAALIIGSDEPHYTASKIYPLLMSGRPYLSLLHRQSSAHAILSAAGGGFAHAFGDDTDEESMSRELVSGLRTLAVDPAGIKPADPSVFSQYTAAAVARRYADIFAQIASVP
jgi:glycosyltransferase involved in cell wall biosynthesis